MTVANVDVRGSGPGRAGPAAYAWWPPIRLVAAAGLMYLRLPGSSTGLVRRARQLDTLDDVVDVIQAEGPGTAGAACLR